MLDWGGIFGLLGPISLTVALVILGLLSKRLGQATHMPRYYIGFYIAALMVGVGVLARVANLTRDPARLLTLQENDGWLLLYDAVPAIGLTVGLITAWRYWSWLLAERG